MKTYKIYQVDSFTRDRFHGNPAGVVPDAKGLTDEQMLRIARELNNSETAFMFETDSPDYDIEVRFFTPTTEVPICGHATIAPIMSGPKREIWKAERSFKKQKQEYCP